MSTRWSGLVRAGAAAAVGAGLVYAAVQVPFAVSLTPAVERASSPQATLAPVASATLTCPGAETEGLQGVPAVPGTTMVYASSPPAEVLQGLSVGTGQGSLALSTAAGGGGNAASVDTAGKVVQGTVSGTALGQVTASGPLAPGVAALQTTLSPDGDDRAAISAPCLAAKAELWLVAGGGGSTRRERVVLVNPGANPVSADVSVLGSGGLLPSANGQHVSVPPHGRASLLVDALVGPEQTPVVHVVASGGVLTGVVEDSWVDGATGRGADDAVASADPSNEQVIPAAFLDGPARLRVVAPGNDETVVQARALTKDGPVALPSDGVLRIPRASVRELDLSKVPAGAYAIQVRADHPVVAGLMVERRGTAKQPSDFAWSTSTAAIPVVAGSPLPDNTAGATLMLVATGDIGSATVYTVSATGAVDARPFALPADSVASVDVTGARQVWVRQTAGTIRAGVALAFTPAGQPPLFSLVPLNPALVSATQVPVRQVPG